ncbi:hypothetical protein HK104_007783, partial [Borealophlyctis nickersoniae]
MRSSPTKKMGVSSATAIPVSGVSTRPRRGSSPVVTHATSTFATSAPAPSFTLPPGVGRQFDRLKGGQNGLTGSAGNLLDSPGAHGGIGGGMNGIGAGAGGVGGNGGAGVAKNMTADECVDYLSYKFDAFDLHQCWRHATRKKDSISNGRRLENASWRKFFQMRFGLSTVNPASLNWQKDSDVVWLYGPFHTYQPLPVLQAQYAAAAKAHAKALGLKPALKRQTDQEKFAKTLRDLEKKTVRMDGGAA